MVKGSTDLDKWAGERRRKRKRDSQSWRKGTEEAGRVYYERRDERKEREKEENREESGGGKDGEVNKGNKRRRMV